MALRPTSCKEAILRWENNKKAVAAEATFIDFSFQWPPLKKMDGALSTLVECEKFTLSSNMIEKINGLAGMRNLKILSLGRNYINSLAGIDAVADTLEVLIVSYNLIDKMKGIGLLKKLRVLHMAHNKVYEWLEFMRLQDMDSLRELIFSGNPICENQVDAEAWRIQACNRMPQLTKLDGETINRV